MYLPVYLSKDNSDAFQTRGRKREQSIPITDDFENQHFCFNSTLHWKIIAKLFTEQPSEKYWLADFNKLGLGKIRKWGLPISKASGFAIEAGTCLFLPFQPMQWDGRRGRGASEIPWFLDCWGQGIWKSWTLLPWRAARICWVPNIPDFERKQNLLKRLTAGQDTGSIPQSLSVELTRTEWVNQQEFKQDPKGKVPLGFDLKCIC